MEKKGQEGEREWKGNVRRFLINCFPTLEPDLATQLVNSTDFSQVICVASYRIVSHLPRIVLQP